MPELPDITLYLEALECRLRGRRLERLSIRSPFLLRTAAPPIQSICGLKALAFRRLGKRIAIGFENDLWLVLHLMIAGRLHWMTAAAAPTQLRAGGDPKRLAGSRRGKLANQQAEFIFNAGTLVLTEAGTTRRASLHLVQGQAGLARLDPGGLEVMDCSIAEFSSALTRENHTLKRSLTDPHLFSGIGNSYSDEILHSARLSPVALTQKLAPDQIARLHQATKQTLKDWTDRLRRETGDGFPEKVTAFRPEMAVHGKFGKPCPDCGSTVQRIRYADNETNYCPTCQTGGKLLADRALSLLLKRDWPRTPEELEELRGRKSH